MKNPILKVLVFTFSVFFSSEVFSQLHFGVSPGLQMNGAVFGYKMKKFVPYIGLQLMSGSVNFTQSGKRYDSNVGAVVDYTDKIKASGTVYMPSIGLKYFFNETGKLKAYGNISFTKFILSAKIDDNSNPSAAVDLDKAIKNLSIFGAQLGFGTEYFFDDNFSIGGEFGLRLVHLKRNDDFIENVYDPNLGSDVPSTTTNSTLVNFNPTYTKFSLNYYFGK